MTNSQIILAVISSSVLASALTSGVNYLLTNLKHKQDFHKKIYENRFAAYQQVYSFLYGLKTLIHDVEENAVTPYLLSNGLLKLDEQIVMILLPLKNGLWLSSELGNELTQMNLLLKSISDEARSSHDPDKALIILGNNYLDKIRTQHKKIQKQIKIDLKNMHDVNSFLS